MQKIKSVTGVVCVQYRY